MRVKKDDYDVLIPPLDKHVWDLNNKEAEEYFNWFVLNAPARAIYISNKISEELNVDMSKIMYTKESLVHIWEWFLERAEIENPKKSWLKRFEDVEDAYFSALTLYIIRDIGMYLGEMFITNYETINWSYYTKPKTDFYVNTPILTPFYDYDFKPPFKMVFDPLDMVEGIAHNILEATSNKNDLLKLYNEWAEKI